MKSQYINISTVMLVRLCVLAIMVIAYSGCDNDPPPPPPPDTPSVSLFHDCQYSFASPLFSGIAVPFTCIH